ncbi:MAG: hypothetical protein OXJ53_19005 [Gammaproteobacteria bacterium]|nr:hypothetical protein [Gammaproteobacteria bacterium]
MTFSVKPQKTGIQIFFDGKQVGGWNVNRKHFFLLASFVRDDAKRVQLIERALKGCGSAEWRDGRYWELPEGCLSTFRETVKAATGERLRLHG